MTATRNTRSTCPYCGVGCGVIIESNGKQITPSTRIEQASLDRRAEAREKVGDGAVTR